MPKNKDRTNFNRMALAGGTVVFVFFLFMLLINNIRNFWIPDKIKAIKEFGRQELRRRQSTSPDLLPW